MRQRRHSARSAERGMRTDIVVEDGSSLTERALFQALPFPHIAAQGRRHENLSIPDARCGDWRDDLGSVVERVDPRDAETTVFDRDAAGFSQQFVTVTHPH